MASSISSLSLQSRSTFNFDVDTKATFVKTGLSTVIDFVLGELEMQWGLIPGDSWLAF